MKVLEIFVSKPEILINACVKEQLKYESLANNMVRIYYDHDFELFWLGSMYDRLL